MMVSGAAVRHWVLAGWRMVYNTLEEMAKGLVLCFVFLFCVVIFDEDVVNGVGAKVDYLSLTSLFLTINLMPMIWLVYTNDNVTMKSLKQVATVVSSKKKIDNVKKKVLVFFLSLHPLSLSLHHLSLPLFVFESSNRWGPSG